MPRKPGRKNLNATVSAEQYRAASKAAAFLDMNLAEYLRFLVQNDVEARGGVWPDNLPAQGKGKEDPLKNGG